MFENFDWIGAMRNSPVMIIIMGCSVVTLGFAIERALCFWKRRQDPEPLCRRVSDLLKAGQTKEAAWACRTTMHPVGPVASQVLEHAHLGPEAVEEKLQITLSEQRLLLERNLGVLGTMGNANARFFHGPGINNFDVGLQKITKLRESMAVQFRAEFFNAMGHAQFNNPSGSFTSGNFGRVTSARAGRIGQMSLKFLW